MKKKKNENSNRVQHGGDEEIFDAPPSTIPAPSVLPPQASSDNENTESEEEPFVLPLATAPPLIAKPISPIIATTEEPSALALPLV